MANQAALIAFAVACLVTFHVGLCVEHPFNVDTGIMNTPARCPCSSFASCQRKHYHPADPTDKQVMVVSKGRRTWQDWSWEFISTVISADKPNKELMCYTHMKGKQYGFVVKLKGFTEMKNSTDLLWISDHVKLARGHFADYVLLDMLDALNEDNLNTTRLSQLVVHFTFSLHSIAAGTKLMCLLPWNPLYLRGENDPTLHKVLLNTLIRHCDKFVTDSRSYFSPRETCRARASVPFTKLVYGVDEYVAEGVPVEKFFLGVPWHGYDYTCDTYDKKTNSCLLQPPSNVAACDYKKARKQMSLGDMRKKWPKAVMRISGHEWERYTMSPYFTYTDQKTVHEVRFEDLHSLTLKYHLSRELDMGGVLIWTADDLNYNDDENAISYDKLMWNLLKDSMFKPVRNHYFMDEFKAFPSKMAGVGVGCMLLGTVLGFVIGAVICVRRQRKTLKPPFMKDHPQEYQDEDPNM